MAMLAAAPAAAGGLSLGLPIACDPGKDCWVQQYFDHDPSTAAKDYACGAETYDGHDGTDIRIRDTASEANVVAAADGIVRAVRDGEDDHLMRTEADRAAVAKVECGNGVLIRHGGGWETQYCHLRQGSVVVKPGDRVTKGQRLGDVGYSGMAAFPHVHLTVRSRGKAVDPFRSSAGDSCGGAKDALWEDGALAALSYQRGAILRSGFAAGPVDLPDLETGGATTAAVGKPRSSWPALIAYVWAINLEKDDQIIVTMEGPGGISVTNSARLDRAKAQYMLFAGKKQPSGGWPAGSYEARVEIRNGGSLRLAQSWRTTID